MQYNAKMFIDYVWTEIKISFYVYGHNPLVILDDFATEKELIKTLRFYSIKSLFN